MTCQSGQFTQKSLKVMCLAVISGLLIGFAVSPLAPTVKFRNALGGQYPQSDYSPQQNAQPTLTIKLQVSPTESSRWSLPAEPGLREKQ